ncbi:3-hydroxy-3-methylglutaryl-CoA reductase [Thermopolyspora sp. NPDC052614]|uniref:3-hydroxy-3-methylglutaryl-CoA reductase n=1 Tax=Thermopolyspora sp. NPDC052614 TaxID=3155682 RepID=UPI00341EDFEF
MTAYRHSDCREAAAQQSREKGVSAGGPGVRLSPERRGRVVDEAVGATRIPVRVAAGFTVNGRDVPVPMAIEDPSVVAGAAEMARVAGAKGGFEAVSMSPLVQGQIQILDVADPAAARMRLFQAAPELIDLANAQEPRLVALGGGAREIIVRLVRGSRQTYVVLHLLIDVRDGLGIGPVETMMRAVVARAAEVAGGRAIVHGVAAKADLLLTRVRAVFDAASLGGARVVDDMIDAAELAEADAYRAAGQNKEIMDGVAAVVLATGNDTRAVQAAAHVHAAGEDGRYTSLSHFAKNEDGDLVGTIEFPVPVGLADVAAHPMVRANLARMRVRSAMELAQVILAVGLARNVAVLHDRVAGNTEHDRGAEHGRGAAYDRAAGDGGSSGGSSGSSSGSSGSSGGSSGSSSGSSGSSGGSSGSSGSSGAGGRRGGFRARFDAVTDAVTGVEAGLDVGYGIDGADGIDWADARVCAPRRAHEQDRFREREKVETALRS